MGLYIRVIRSLWKIKLDRWDLGSCFTIIDWCIVANGKMVFLMAGVSYISHKTVRLKILTENG
jgi:hypothetical protein